MADRVDFSSFRGVAVIHVAGDLDLPRADAFRATRDGALALRQALVVDLSDCTFIDSTGIAMVLRSFQLAQDRDRPFALVGSAPQVRNVLELVGIPEMVPCHSDLDAAIEDVLGQEV